VTPEHYYQSYLADDNMAPLNEKLVERVLAYYPGDVLEFGCGTGKNLKAIKQKRLSTFCYGLDVSLINVIHANIKNELPFVSVGNESLLRYVHNFDVIFTCSVLDHIKDVDGIIKSFQQIAKRAVVLAETNDVPGEFYFPHNYESYGFHKIDFEWKSNGDGATYHIWVWHNTKFPDHEDFPY